MFDIPPAAGGLPPKNGGASRRRKVAAQLKVKASETKGKTDPPGPEKVAKSPKRGKMPQKALKEASAKEPSEKPG